MVINTDIPEFSGSCRLFPLPNVVLFPHVILPLHIFEPRYRQMTRDALDDDQLVTIVQLRPSPPGSPAVEPASIMNVACLGKIVQHDLLADGRYNILLLGCKRVRLNGEVASGKLYRIAAATVLEDEKAEGADEPRRAELIELFLEALQLRHRVDPDLSQLLQSGLPLGVLSDVIAHALDLPAPFKQTLLDEPRVDCRVASLLPALRNLVGRVPPARGFPPAFSAN
jgi:uncharacterized protein